MGFQQEWVFQVLKDYAYEPTFVYFAVIGMMIASGFGFPLPEEVTIVSVGLLTYMGAHPDLFPAPYEGAKAINGYEAAAVTLVAVVFADVLVFYLGRVFGRRIMRIERFKAMFADRVMARINSFTSKYGAAAAFIFRFTPGIRFPAHIAMGMSHLSVWKFILVDGLAALISVPSQILLIYHYGESILKVIHEFKMVLLALIAGGIFVWLVRKIWLRIMQPQA